MNASDEQGWRVPLARPMMSVGPDDQCVYLDVIRRYYPAVYATWGDGLERALQPVELGRRSQEVLIVALDAVIHAAPPVIEHRINEAFEVGSNIAELLEAIMFLAYVEGGGHAVHDGLEALRNVVDRRQAAGLPTPRRGEPLGSSDKRPKPKPPVPPVFPYQDLSNWPHEEAMARFDPELHTAWLAWTAARWDLRKGLTLRLQELLITAIDAVILWPAPLIDNHIHQALDLGSNVQEITEVLVTSAIAVQGKREGNIAARRVPGGLEILLHGLSALDRVLGERDAVGLPRPAEKLAAR